MILNYILAILKIIGMSLLLSIPITLIILISKKIFQDSKRKFIYKLSITTYIVSLVAILLLYFIPVFQTNLIYEKTFIEKIIFVILHVIWLMIVNLLISGIIIVFGIIAKGIYDSMTKNKDKKLNIYKLIISVTITNLIFLIVYMIFPKLIPMIIYLIYLL